MTKTLQQLETEYDAAVAERDRLFNAMTDAERRALTGSIATTEAQRQYNAACNRVHDVWWEHTSLVIMGAP